MKQRAFGATGLTISEIVFGAGAVGGIVFEPSRELSVAAVRRALELGVSWIDTAPQYGKGRSEENLGCILQELGASPRVSTKVRLRPDDCADPAGAVERSLVASLERLQSDRVDLIQLHTAVTRERGTLLGSISLDDVLRPGGVADALDRVCQRGLSQLCGFTGFGDTDCLHALVDSGRFHSLQAYYNVLNPSAGQAVSAEFPGQDFERLIDRAASAGMGVIVIRALSAGSVLGAEHAHRAVTWTPGSSADRDADLAGALHDALGERAESVVEIALRFALMHAGVSGVAVGFSEIAHIEQAAAAATAGALPEAVSASLSELRESAFAPSEQ